MVIKEKTRILVFVCNWDGLSCVEAAVQADYHFPAFIKIMRISCLSRIHLGLILKAFELGAEGVLLIGCEPGNCNFDVDSKYIVDECRKARDILKLLGIEEERLILSYIIRGDAQSFTEQITDFTEKIERLRSLSLSRT